MDVQFPAEILEIIRKSADKHKTDIPAATSEAERKIRARPDFGSVVDTLVRAAIQEQVYVARHRITSRIKYETGQYGGPPKVIAGESVGGRRAAISCYEHRIAGTILGLVLGENLMDIADSEDAIGNGHLFNARLAMALRPLVPDGKYVKDAVPEKKLRVIMENLRTSMGGGTAMAGK